MQPTADALWEFMWENTMYLWTPCAMNCLCSRCRLFRPPVPPLSAVRESWAPLYSLDRAVDEKRRETERHLHESEKKPPVPAFHARRHSVAPSTNVVTLHYAVDPPGLVTP